jgi:hypothetical protein
MFALPAAIKMAAGLVRRVPTWVVALTALQIFSGSADAQYTPFIQWDFNNSSLSPSLNSTAGTPVANTVGLTGTSTFPLVADGLSGDSTGNNTNRVWQTAGYPASGSSGTAGVEFTGLNTTGRDDLLFSFSIGAPSSAGQWYQLQYRVGTSGQFQNYGAAIGFRNIDNTTPWANGSAYSLAALASTENVANLQLRVVSVFAPGTTGYQGVGGTYNPNTPVSFDLVTLAQANRLSSNAASTVDLLSGSNWSLGQINSGMMTSHLVFGPNSAPGSTVTLSTGGSFFNALSMTFRENVNKSHIYNDGLILGRGSANNYMSGLPTLVNASGYAHTFQSTVVVAGNQTWSVGPTQGAQLTFNGGVQFGSQSSDSNLLIQGAGTVEANGGFQSFGGAATVTRTGGLLKLADTAFTFFPVNYVVGQSGVLQIANPSNGSATNGGTVIVNTGGRLEGTGRIAGASGTAVTVNPGGVIRGGVGSNIATPLTVSGNVRVVGASGGNGGTLAVQLATSGSTITGASRVDIADAGNALNFDVTGGAFKIKLLNDGSLQLNQPYTIIVANSAGGYKRNGTTVTSYTYGSDFVIDSDVIATFGPVSLNDIGGGNLRLGFTALSFHPVPEPALPAAVAFVTMAMGAAFRRLRRNSENGSVDAACGVEPAAL